MKKDSDELTKTSFAKKNPYADVDKDLSVDVPEISQDAIKLYQKDILLIEDDSFQ